uniref:Uncharacterized protein n=1 Tax=Paramoeba aestuarina TaxID=180227 RepID=A0A7S4K292_9EUKA
MGGLVGGEGRSPPHGLEETSSFSSSASPPLPPSSSLDLSSPTLAPPRHISPSFEGGGGRGGGGRGVGGGGGEYYGRYYRCSSDSQLTTSLSSSPSSNSLSSSPSSTSQAFSPSSIPLTSSSSPHRCSGKRREEKEGEKEGRETPPLEIGFLKRLHGDSGGEGSYRLF